MNTKPVYRVELAEDGCDVEFAGDCDTIKEARALASSNPTTLPKSLYDTAKAAGHVAGMNAPSVAVSGDCEPIEWVGDFAISRVIVIDQ